MPDSLRLPLWAGGTAALLSAFTVDARVGEGSSPIFCRVLVLHWWFGLLRRGPYTSPERAECSPLRWLLAAPHPLDRRMTALTTSFGADEHEPPTERPATSVLPIDDVREFLHAHQSEIIAELTEWARIPSIAAQPEHAVDLERSARWLAGAFRSAGLKTDLIHTGATVAVVAEVIVHPALPTVLVYSHHDVRHAKPEEWRETSPFSPVLRDGRLYGRGTSDAKGQVLAHLWGLRAHLAAQDSGRPAVNLKFVIEGEEEMGSPNFEELLTGHLDRFACDVIVFSDTLQWQDGEPAVVTSMRGMVSASLEVFGPHRDVHSGTVSGTAPNPAKALVEVLAALHHPDGTIAIPGFYDSVEKISEERRRELAALTFDESDWDERTEIAHLSGETGFTAEERLWARPSLEILSLLAGDPTGIARAVIPAKAAADVNIRTVPGQRVADVAEQLRQFFEGHMPDNVSYSLTVDESTGQEPYTTPEGKALDALQRAMARGHGRVRAGRMGNAGGGPAELMASTLHAPVLFVGTGLPEDHWHASDESVSIDTLLQGAASIAYFWTELGSALAGGREPRAEP